jgi:hypothetical protein
MTYQHPRSYSKIFFIIIIALCAAGCTTLAKKEDSGVVIARRAQVRSSVAVVAADLVEVNRGDVVDILDTDTAENGERWLRVRVHNEESTEGWIEARNVMPQDVLDKSKELAQEDKEIPAQATGQLRASTNVRLTPDRTNNDNIMMKLESGSKFEIVSWKRVPKPQSSESTAEHGPRSQRRGRTERARRDQRGLVQGASGLFRLACAERVDLRQTG